jgi:hypothetical protein
MPESWNSGARVEVSYQPVAHRTHSCGSGQNRIIHELFEMVICIQFSWKLVKFRKGQSFGIHQRVQGVVCKIVVI